MPRLQLVGAYALLCVVLGAVAGGVVGSTRPTDYTATASVAVAGGGLRSSLEPGNISLAPGRLVEPALRAAGAGGVLQTVPPSNRAGSIYGLAKLDLIAELAAARSSSKYTAEQFKAAVSASADLPLGVVFIAASDANPGIAAELANSYSDALVAYVSDGQIAEYKRLKSRLRELEAASADVPGSEGTAFERNIADAAEKLRVVGPILTKDPTLQVALRAEAPKSGSAPSLGPYVIIGAAVGLLLGALLAAIGYRRRVVSRDWAADPAAALGAPVLAELDDEGLADGFPRDPHGLPAGSRALASAVAKLLDERGAHTLAVCPSQDEKVTTAVTWALAASWTGRSEKVLLIEADTSNPTFGAALGAERTEGLAALDAFASQSADPEVGELAAGLSERAVTRVPLTDGNAVDLVPADGDERRAEELAPDPVFQQFLADAAASYDRVLLEAPAEAAAVALAAQMKYAIVVVRVGGVSRHAAQRQIRALRQAGAKVLGLIVVGEAAAGDGPRDTPHLDADITPEMSSAAADQVLTHPQASSS